MVSKYHIKLNIVVLQRYCYGSPERQAYFFFEWSIFKVFFFINENGWFLHIFFWQMCCEVTHGGTVSLKYYSINYISSQKKAFWQERNIRHDSYTHTFLTHNICNSVSSGWRNQNSSARNHDCAGLLLYATWGISALQPLVAEMSNTKTNTKITLKKITCFHGWRKKKNRENYPGKKSFSSFHGRKNKTK